MNKIREVTGKGQPSENQEVGTLLVTGTTASLILDVLASRTVRNNIGYCPSMVICYSSPY